MDRDLAAHAVCAAGNAKILRCSVPIHVRVVGRRPVDSSPSDNGSIVIDSERFTLGSAHRLHELHSCRSCPSARLPFTRAVRAVCSDLTIGIYIVGDTADLDNGSVDPCHAAAAARANDHSIVIDRHRLVRRRSVQTR